MIITNTAFILFTTIALASAILASTSRAPAQVILYLILTFAACSGAFITLNLDLLAIFFMIIYAGAIMILFLFIIMMINLQKNEKKIFYSSTITTLFFIFIFGVLEILIIMDSLGVQTLNYNNLFIIQNTFTETFSFIMNQHLETALVEHNNIKKLSIGLFITYYPLIFIIALLLLLGIITAITLTLEKKHEAKMQDYFKQMSRSNRITLISNNKK